MPNTDYTDITLIWDRSGSMASMGAEPVGSYQAFLEDQAKTPGKCHVSALLFDHEYAWAYRDVPVAEAGAKPFPWNPRGNTALFDAVGRAITEAGMRFAAMDEPERPGKVIFVILTDGLENSSKDWNRAGLRNAIERQTRDYGWSFVYLGVAAEAFVAEARSIGTSSAMMANYAQGVPGAAAGMVAQVSKKVAAYRSTGVGGQSLGSE